MPRRFGCGAARSTAAPMAAGRETSSAPVIRDLGATLAMRPQPETVRMVLNAQMGKVGAPLDGKDLHIGDFEWGILPPGGAADDRDADDCRHGDGVWPGRFRTRRHLVHRRRRFIARRMARGDQPVRGAEAAGDLLSREQSDRALDAARRPSAVRVFAGQSERLRCAGLSRSTAPIPIRSRRRFTWAADRARAGEGPTLIETVSMRMCGHAHHDDMLYLGRDPQPSWEYAPLTEQGYADRDLYEYWAARDPIALYAARLEADGIIGDGDLERFKREAEAAVDVQARAVIEAPWPKPEKPASACSRPSTPRKHIEVLVHGSGLKPDATHERERRPPIRTWVRLQPDRR
jgi:hypothetical protein